MIRNPARADTAFDRLSRELRSVAESLEKLQARAAQGSLCGRNGSDAALAAEWLYRSRRERDAHFPSGLFAEPSWDILLDLYVAAATAREVSVSSSCLASASPATTALRHLANLESVGLVRRRPDPEDPRRNFVELTSDGAARMESFLRTVLQPRTHS